MTDVKPMPAPFAEAESGDYRLARDFTEQIANFPWVKLVVLLECPEHQVRVVIDAPEFDPAYRTPIYEAEMRVLHDARPDSCLDFYLTNRRERPGQMARSRWPGEIVLLER